MLGLPHGRVVPLLGVCPRKGKYLHARTDTRTKQCSEQPQNRNNLQVPADEKLTKVLAFGRVEWYSGMKRAEHSLVLQMDLKVFCKVIKDRHKRSHCE